MTLRLGPERVLQVAVMKLAREVIAAPYRLRAFDRSRNESGVQHLYEASRGVRVGTPDTELICQGMSCNIELKAPGTRHLKSHQPTAQQLEEMRLLREAGAYAATAWSCTEVVAHWRAAGVPLCAIADAIAAGRDRTILCGPTMTARAARRWKRARASAGVVV